MKVCHIITGLNTGGAETVLCRLIESLRPPAFEHTVVALGAEGSLSARVAKSAALHHLAMRRGRLTPSSLLNLRRVLCDTHPNVIHAWMYHGGLATSLAAAGIRVPVVWGIRHSLDDLAREKRATRLVIRACALLSRKPRRILYNAAISAKQHAAFGYSGERAIVISNGFDTETFAPDPSARDRLRAELGIGPDSIAIGMVARVHPLKDHANFLHAAALLKRSCPRAIFVLVGDGLVPENAELMTLLRSLDIGDRVRLCGRRTDIAGVNCALDVATLSSRSEAFPNVVGEAMACGVPCVATDVGDVAELIGDTGIVVPPSDPPALCAGWLKLARLEADDRRVMGTRARQRIVERYSLAVMVQRYGDMYKDLITADL